MEVAKLTSKDKEIIEELKNDLYNLLSSYKKGDFGASELVQSFLSHPRIRISVERELPVNLYPFSSHPDWAGFGWRGYDQAQKDMLDVGFEPVISMVSLT